MPESFIQEWKDLEYHGIMEPETLDECEGRRLQIVADVMDIQTQLSNKDHRDGDGRRLSDIAYHQWRAKAVGALRWKTRELRALKEWRKRAEAAVRSPSISDGSLRFYLQGTLRVLGAVLAREGLSLTSVEQRHIDQARAKLAEPIQLPTTTNAPETTAKSASGAL